ncbi:MAG: L,D-transpeptidase family protein [Sphingobacteriales bacterium]|nr:MAG: L,D-transpeptidase family protein [Sphingobacteriales bacterium]
MIRRMFQTTAFFGALLFALFLSGCQGLLTSEEDKLARRKVVADSLMQVNIGQLLKKNYPADSIAKLYKPKNAAFLGQELEVLYAKTQHKPVWLNPENGHPLPAAAQYIQALKNAGQHALNPEKYQYSLLSNAFDHLRLSETAPYDTLLDEKAHLDALLSVSALAYTSDLSLGYVTPKGNWDIPEKKPPLAQQLLQTVQNNSIDQLIEQSAPAYKEYKSLQQLLAEFSKEAEKTPASKVPGFNLTYEEMAKKIALNMERYRWLPHPDSMSARRVWVNIPEYKMRVFDNHKETDQIVVVVGELKHATPVLVDKPMSNVVFSPTWTIPSSIGWEEMEYIIQNPAVLIVADVDVFIDGKLTDPREVDWSTISKKRVKMRQRPKLTNSMGLVKFPFSNNYGIYIHDTPNKVDFGGVNRAQSHGCVRVQEPKKLALKMLEGSNWNEGGITKAMYSGKEQYAKLPQPVSVTIFYITTLTDENGKLRLAPDVYGHDRRQMNLL